jgi:HNH endonuclease
MVREADNDAVEIPHGLVALFWIRQFKPLLDLEFPQSPTNVGYRGLEFAKGSLALLTFSPLDLRVAGRFTQLQAAHLASSLRWSDPERDVALARNCALKLLNAGQLTCVWSGRPLRADTLDVDHCFPWSAWPCDHLWNLLPAHKEVNQREKRDRLPSANHLREAENRITSWWSNGYSLERNEALTDRFFAEAESALPWLEAGVAVNVEDVFRGLEVQRLRLHHDQQVPEWKGRW